MFKLWQIKLIPKEEVSFSLYPGFSMHGAFLNFIARYDKLLASELHDESVRARDFKLSFSLPKNNIYEKGKPVLLNIGSVSESLNSLLLKLAESKEAEDFNIRPIPLSVKSVSLIKSLTFEEATEFVLPPSFTILFRSPTCFRSSGRHLLFPDSKVLFSSLAIKWNSLFTLQVEINEQEMENILISSYDLKTSVLKLKNFSLIGFVGNVRYSARSLGLKSRKKLGKLLVLADFLGVGYRTTMGLGDCKIIVDKGK